MVTLSMFLLLVASVLAVLAVIEAPRAKASWALVAVCLALVIQQGVVLLK